MTGGLVDLALTITLAPAGPTEPGDAALTLAKNLSECNVGALARILPMAAATNQIFAEARRLLAQTYYLDFIVASHDCRRAGFTSVDKKSEVLLVCRPRGRERNSTSATKAINLAQNPSTIEDARAIATRDCKQTQRRSDQSPTKRLGV